LKHVLGTKMEKIDGLSRRLDWKIGMEKDNKNQIFIKDHWCYDLKLKGLSNKTTLVLSNTRELDRVPSTE